MKSKEEIVELLTSKLSSVYCDTCDPTDKYADEDDDDASNCEGCHRKMMNWCLSKGTAEQLAEEILA